VPSHIVHVKWSKKLIGKARPEVDKFLDDFIKEINDKILEECIEECKSSIRGDNIENILEFYEQNLGIEISRYSIGLLLYTYLDTREQIKIIKNRLRIHDSWRIFDPCLVFKYIEKIFDREAIYITLIHMILDEIARLVKISYTDSRRGVESILSTVLSIYPQDDIYDLASKIRSRIREIIRDVAFSIGINIDKILATRHILLVKDLESSYRNMLSIPNVEVLNIYNLDYDNSRKVYSIVREFCRKFNVKVSISINPITGHLSIRDDMLLICQFRRCSGDIYHVVYPHVVNVYPVGNVKINIYDYVQDVRSGVMRLGPMKDD